MLEHRNPNPALPKRVVVLGARGIIGKALVARLKAEFGCGAGAELVRHRSARGSRR